MAISSPGVGSGLDVNGIVSQLMAVERQPLLRLDQKEAQAQAQISAYGSLKSALAELQDSLSTLKEITTFQATKATASESEILSVSSTTSAVTSSYNVTVNRLAQQHKLGSSEFASDATFGGVAGDELTVTASGKSFTLDLSTAMTLSEIQQAINVESNETGVAAGLITGDGGNQTLVLTSGETGYDNRIEIAFGGTIDAATFNFAMLNHDEEGVVLASENELDASMTVDGVAVTRGSNNIDDVVEGVEFGLQGLGQSSVSIGRDSSVAESAVQAFIEAYNGVKEQLANARTNGISNSLFRGVEAQLRGVLNNSLGSLGEYAYLSEFGITSSAGSGELELESEKLISALEENRESVIAFFSDEDSGFAVGMENMLEGYLKSGGTLDSVVRGANDKVDSIERSRDSMERRLEMIEQRYLDQFGALDTLMANMTTTSEYLASQLDMLSNMVSNQNK